MLFKGRPVYRTPSQYSRGYLPHRDERGSVVGITFRLADSVPARMFREYGAFKARHSQHGNATTRIQTHLERFLGRGRGACVLRDPRAARVVEETLFERENRDYEIIAWVVMPNHVHVLIRRTMTGQLSDIVQAWKGASARRINLLLGRTGTLWFRDYFDRSIDLDSPHHFDDAICYIELNPVAAGLCARPTDWPFSSARRHPEWWHNTPAIGAPP